MPDGGVRLDPFAHVVIADTNPGQTETVTVTPSSTANGVLSDPNASTDGGTVGENGVYTVSGTTAQVTAALDGLVFTPNAHVATANTPVIMSFTINVTDTAGETASDATTSVQATYTGRRAVDHRTGAQQAGDDRRGQPETARPCRHHRQRRRQRGDGDGDAVGDGQWRVVDPNAATDGGTVGANGVYTVSGTTAQVTAALDGLVFTPTAHRSRRATVTTTFTIGRGRTAGGDRRDDDRRGDSGQRSADDHRTGGETDDDGCGDSNAIRVMNIGDADFGQTETVTITLSNKANGAWGTRRSVANGSTG